MSSATGAAALRRNGSGWYLYGVVAADRSLEEPVAGASVDPAHEVVLVSEGSVAGVASRVGLDEFDEAALPERLGDSAWLKEKIRAHEQVLEDVLAAAAVVPCRFCTVYRSEDELRNFLSARGEVLADALQQVDGKVELGVKGFLDDKRFAAAQAERNDEIRELEARASEGGGGRAYLESRRLERLLAGAVGRFSGEVGGQIHDRLLEAAEDGLTLPLQAPELSGRQQAMLFNGAYLVEDRRGFEDAVVRIAADHRENGIDLELTGPWPPYNFVPAELGA